MKGVRNLVRNFGVSRLDRLGSELAEATKRAPLEQMDTYQEVTNQVEKLRNAETKRFC